MLKTDVTLKIIVSLLALVTLSSTEETKSARHRRAGFEESFPSGNNQLNIGSSFDLGSYEGSHVPLQQELFSSGIDKYLPIQQLNPVEINLKVNLPTQKSHFAIPVAYSNSVEKPVEEAQEFVPPQSVGTAIIPQMPPPATPVNAVASNVPGNNGAVFLGSGSLGVVSLGNGAYALGSGSLGYSDNRQNPRPNGMSPLYPPLQASPNLIPAATPSSQPPQLGFPAPQLPSNIDFNHPMFNEPRQLDPNGYEYLPPNRIGFGTPLQRLPRLKTTQSYATPTALQQTQLIPQQVSSGQLNFVDRVPSLYSFESGY